MGKQKEEFWSSRMGPCMIPVAERSWVWTGCFELGGLMSRPRIMPMFFLLGGGGGGGGDGWRWRLNLSF